VNKLRKTIAAAAVIATATLGAAMATPANALAAPPASDSAVASPASTSAPTLTKINCFQLYSAFNNFSNAATRNVTDERIYFNAPSATNFCQWRVGTTNNVVIRLYGFNECLALNASLNDVYLHGATGCDGTLSYTVWHFIDLGGGIHALQLQYDYQGIGVNKPCLYSGTAPAEVASCTAASTNLFYQYQLICI
jgi:hypothetical protein